MVLPLVQGGKSIILSDGSVLCMDRNIKVVVESRQSNPANCSATLGAAKVIQCTNENGLTLENLLRRRNVATIFDAGSRWTIMTE